MPVAASQPPVDTPEPSRPSTLGQRLARNIRQTDWWAVVVELLVVVLGILIAFELNEWDQRRQDREQERLVLQHIAEEAAGDLAALKRIRDQHLASAQNFQWLLDATADQAAARGYNERSSDPCNLLRVPAVRRASAGAGGLGAGERLALIEDHELRDRLRRAEADRSFAESQIGYFRDSFQHYSRSVETSLVFDLATPDNRCRVDVDRLLSNPMAVRMLSTMGRDQDKLAEYRTNELEATAAVLSRVQCLQSGKCRPRLD